MAGFVVCSISWNVEAMGRIQRCEARCGGRVSSEGERAVRAQAPWPASLSAVTARAVRDLPVTLWPWAFLCLQMVWESGCVVIVMLTPLSENGVRQCYHYWPDEGSNLYHIYEVLPKSAPACRATENRSVPTGGGGGGLSSGRLAGRPGLPRACGP